MPPKKAPRRRDPDVLPDTLPKRGTEPDVLPDDLRRVDQPEVWPDSLPRRDDPGADTRPDGGVAQHPIHDEDQEDLQPDDYEREIDDRIATVGESVSEESQQAEDIADEFDADELGPRSIPSRDRDRGPAGG